MSRTKQQKHELRKCLDNAPTPLQLEPNNLFPQQNTYINNNDMQFVCGSDDSLEALNINVEINGFCLELS